MKFNRILAVVITTLIVVISVTTLTLNLRRGKVVIEGQIIGLDSQMIYLERRLGREREVIDSVELSKIGEFRLTLKDQSEEPALYELRCGWERLPILTKGGERISINSLGRLSLNYIIEGSPESELLREFYQPYVRLSEELKRIALKYAAAERNGLDSSVIAREYNNTYNTIKREQLKYVIANKHSLVAIYALFQRLPGDTYLINESSDIVYMRTIAESVAENYPNSPYLGVVNRTIERYEAARGLSNTISYRNYPEIVLNDIFGKSVSLSSLSGSLILVDFWSAELGESNPNNAELKELYEEYHPQGFEIYQVGVDYSRSIWVEAIQQQRLPWISVSDLLGEDSPVLGLYNVTNLPANYLINRDGDIVESNIYGKELEQAIEEYIK